MVLTKEEIRDRLRTESVWVTTTRTSLFPQSGAVGERQTRYIVAIWISGNIQILTTLHIEKLEEDGSYTTKFSPIPVAPADFRQIPRDSFDLEDPFLVLEGGTNLLGKVDLAGRSLDVTCAFWDWDIT